MEHKWCLAFFFLWAKGMIKQSKSHMLCIAKRLKFIKFWTCPLWGKASASICHIPLHGKHILLLEEEWSLPAFRCKQKWVCVLYVNVNYDHWILLAKSKSTDSCIEQHAHDATIAPYLKVFQALPGCPVPSKPIPSRVTASTSVAFFGCSSEWVAGTILKSLFDNISNSCWQCSSKAFRLTITT